MKPLIFTFENNNDTKLMLKHFFTYSNFTKEMETAFPITLI